MHRIFQTFIDRLSSASDSSALRDAMTAAATGLDLSCFAYLSLPERRESTAQVISNYPSAWTSHYLQNHYERFDPVIVRALGDPEPFKWGLGLEAMAPSNLQRELFEEAARFGIQCGFTVPIHNDRGPIAAVTFAADQRSPQFERTITEHARVLQLLTMYFHAHVRRNLFPSRTIGGVSFSRREFECLEWASQGKSAWEIGHILGISRHTAATHLENVKAKLRVRTIVQAVAQLAASRSIGK
jgi:LuxR family transcriptional activator of conjugal transfer of Ti plasmids